MFASVSLCFYSSFFQCFYQLSLCIDVNAQILRSVKKADNERVCVYVREIDDEFRYSMKKCVTLT